jgi:hypothetical protein
MFMIRNKLGTARLVGVVTVALMIAACSDSGTEPRIGDGGGNGSGLTFTSDILPIFEASCIKSGCHASAFPPAGLYLGDYNLVIQRVVSGDPSASLLYTKLQPTGNMPADAGPLSETNRELIRQWILDGAQE